MDIVIPPPKKNIFQKCVPLTLLWFGCLLYLEVLLHIVLFGGFSIWFLYALGFSICAGCLLAWVSGLLGKRGNGRICTVMVCVLCLLYASQMTYNFIFGTMYSLSMVSLGLNAVKTFWRELLSSIWKHLPVLLLCFVPIPAVCLLRKFKGSIFDGGGGVRRLLLPAAAGLLHGILLLCLYAGGTGPFTPYGVYHGGDTTTDRSAGSFGLLTTLRLEMEHMFVHEDETLYYMVEPEPVQNTPAPKGNGGADSEDEPVPVEYGYNVLEIDFDELSASTEDERLLRLNDYCSKLSGTKKNEYTGMLSDYNLIVLCGEAFSTAAVDKELTPTLWRLAHEGFVFTNYFNTYPNTTTDGEYSLCQGLMPDSSRGKTAPSFYASRDSYLPMCLGNIFYEQRGIESFGYHNNYGSFYGRSLTHPNMGYSMKFAWDGMRFSTGSPTSDLEMMEQSIPDYLGQKQFHAYYMTYSGHMAYNLVNPMAAKNYEAVKNLPYSDAAKSYLACNIELDKAMEYLMQQLEDAGVAERTAIVMAGDHFPYGLTEGQYCELIGFEADYFELYRDTLIFWVGGLEEPIEVDEYCCNVDILPTILNLWGFDFDSRLLAGTDVFSDGTHVAMLADHSFLTDKLWFDARIGEATWLVDESEASDNYLENMYALVQNRFSVSTDILNSAYYNFVFGKGAVNVTRVGWITEEEWNGTARRNDEAGQDDTEGENAGGGTGQPQTEAGGGGETGQPQTEAGGGGETGQPQTEAGGGGETEQPQTEAGGGGETGQPQTEAGGGGETGQPPEVPAGTETWNGANPEQT